jgi:hypothetical protein
VVCKTAQVPSSSVIGSWTEPIPSCRECRFSGTGLAWGCVLAKATSRAISGVVRSRKMPITLQGLKTIVQDSRVTVKGWAHYKHQTGRLPWLSIAVHFLNWVVMIAGTVFLIWRLEKYHLGQWGVLGALALVGIPYAVFWFWLKNKVKLKQIRDGRRLANLKRPR